MKITQSRSFVDEDVAADIRFSDDVLIVDLYGPSDTDAASTQDAQDGTDAVINDTPWGKAALKLLGTLTASYSDLSVLPTWADRCVLLAGAGARTWINVTQQTHISKERPAQFIFRSGLESDPLKSRVMLFVPLKSSTFDECAVHILTEHKDYPHLFNGVPVAREQTSPIGAQVQAMPHLVINADHQIQIGATAEIAITMVDADGLLIERDCELYLESIGGSLVSERVHVSKGIGSARVVAIGSQPGDTIRLKAGWRYWTGDAEHTMVVA